MNLLHHSLITVWYENLLFRSFVVEVWAENSKLIGNLDLPTALGAFFHLAFICDLKYPKVWNLQLFLCKVALIHIVGWRICGWLASKDSLQVWRQLRYYIILSRILQLCFPLNRDSLLEKERYSWKETGKLFFKARQTSLVSEKWI